MYSTCASALLAAHTAFSAHVLVSPGVPGAPVMPESWRVIESRIAQLTFIISMLGTAPPRPTGEERGKRRRRRRRRGKRRRRGRRRRGRRRRRRGRRRSGG